MMLKLKVALKTHREPALTETEGGPLPPVRPELAARHRWGPGPQGDHFLQLD